MASFMHIAARSPYFLTILQLQGPESERQIEGRSILGQSLHSPYPLLVSDLFHRARNKGCIITECRSVRC